MAAAEPVASAAVALPPELRRIEVEENHHGREVLYVSYPSTTTVQAVELQWSRALVERGWTPDVKPDVKGEPRRFSGPEGTVALDVWRGLGAVEVNLHRVTAEAPKPERWTDQGLPLIGVPSVVSAHTADAAQELESVTRCGHSTRSIPDELLEIHTHYAEALKGRGWRVLSGPHLTPGSDQTRLWGLSREPHRTRLSSVFRSAERQLVVTLVDETGFCRRVSIAVRPILPRSALGPTWSGEDWASLAGEAGIIVVATQGTAERVAQLVVTYRGELLGPRRPGEDPCPTWERRLQDHWSNALRRRGWRFLYPPQDEYFVRGEGTLDVFVRCDAYENEATVTLIK